MLRDLAAETTKKIGKTVTLYGFINTRRDHGKIIFLDLRDTSGIVQVVATPKVEAAYKIATKLSAEDVIRVVGNVNKRPKENINKDGSSIYLSTDERITIGGRKGGFSDKSVSGTSIVINSDK